MRILGLDLGTSFIKGAVLDLDALTIGQTERLPFPGLMTGLSPAFREFDPSHIVTTVRVLLEQLFTHAPDAAGVVMCSQLHGLIFTTEDGRPLSNFINWQDQRALLPTNGSGTTYFEEINRTLTPDERRVLGNEPRPGVPLCFLYWLVKNNALPKQNAIAASLPNFIIANFCHTAPKSEITNASAHGALNMETGNWHEGAIKKLGLDVVGWPEIVPQGTELGEVRIGNCDLPLFAPVGDYQCAQVGALLENGELSVNISTGSSATMLAHKLEFGDYQTRPFFDDCTLRTVTHIPGGRALNALVKLLSELAEANGQKLDNPWDYILHETSRVGKTDLRVDPAFYFSATGDRGSITNAREENLTVGHLFRAALIGMADNYALCAQRVSPKRDWQRLVFSGGVALKVDLLRQLICERLGTAHRVVASEEDTLLGLLALALAFKSRTRSVAEAMDLLRKNYKPES